jgi:hypothetical protein
VGFIEDPIEDMLWRELLGSIGSSGSGDVGADDKEPSELILGSICRGSDRGLGMNQRKTQLQKSGDVSELVRYVRL